MIYRYRRMFSYILLFIMLISLFPISSFAKEEIIPVVSSIKLNESAETIGLGSVITLNATVYDQSGKEMSGQAINWTSSNSSVAGVTDGKVTAIGTGAAIITASCESATVNCEIAVQEPQVTSIELDKSTLKMPTDSVATLNLKVYDQFNKEMTGQIVDWITSDANVLTVKDGAVTSVGTGSAIVTASCGTKTTDCGITVETPEIKSITLDASNAKIPTGYEMELEATVYDQFNQKMSGQTIEWISSSPSVAAIKNGLTTAVGTGSAIVTASCGSTSATCEITVEDPRVTTFELDKTVAKVATNSKLILVATVKDQFDHSMTNQTMEWSSSNPTVAAIKDGEITAATTGMAIVTATCGSISASCEIIVEDPRATTIKLNKNAATVKTDTEITMTAIVYDQFSNQMSGQVVGWTSSDEKVATVDNGFVRATSKGTATITASSSSASALFIIKVYNPQANSVSLDKTKTKISVGSSIGLNATVKDQFGNEMMDSDISWSTSDEKVASVNENGIVIASGQGTATVSAVCGSKSASCQITVIESAGQNIELDVIEATLKKGSIITIKVIINDSSISNQAITWGSSDEAVATVADGKVEAMSAGEAIITATCGSVSASCTIIVEDEIIENLPVVDRIALDKSNAILRPGTSIALKAIVYDQFNKEMSDQTVTWTSSDGAIATVNQIGFVTAVSQGAVTVSASCLGYAASCNINVIDGYQTNIVIITGTTTFISPLVEGYHNLTEKRTPPYEFGLKIFSGTNLDSNQTKLKEAVKDADVILFQMVADSKIEAFNTLFIDCMNENWKDSTAPAIFVQGCSEAFAASIVKGLTITANSNSVDLTTLTSYINNSGADNCERLLLFLASKYGDVVTTEDLMPVASRGTFAYHPKAEGSGIFTNPEAYYSWYTSRPEYDSSAPWVGILDYDSAYIGGDHDMTTAIVEDLEKKGINVVSIFTPSAKKFESVRSFFFTDSDGDGIREKPVIDTFICSMGFQFNSSDVQKTINLFKEMNVPVITPIYATDLDKWKDNPAGASGEVYWQVAMPELDGRIEPILMGGTKTLDMDKATGAIIQKKVAIADRIERVAGRVSSWARLNKNENKDKNIAIVYYNTDGGKDGIGCTTLNVPNSLAEVLNAMKADGYTLDEDGTLSKDGTINKDKVFDAIFAKGRNIGGWAPGELKKFASQDGIIKISLEQYMEWYNLLPADLRKSVEDAWGPAPGKFMTEGDQMIIPGIISGNVYFGPQPMRGWGENTENITHSPTLPPSHQYLAYYFWLQYKFKADAVVHFGTHGSTEWLPGKSVGLSGEDWGDIVQGNMPNIYPYVVNNPGEGAQAKRRGYAVLIDYLTAAFTNTDLYGNLLELDTLTNEYDTAVVNNAKTEEKDKIIEKIRIILIDEGVGEKIGVSAEDLTQNFDLALKKCKNYLGELEAEVTPLGLHTFGVAPEGVAFESTVNAIINYDQDGRTDMRGEISANLLGTTEEIEMFLLALRGGYIPPSLGHDPIRDPNVMPTGKNIVSFDPRNTPDKASWEIGKKCADDLVAAYYTQHNSYPESVGIVLWAIETMRDGGEGIATAMRLIGVEPIWKSSRVIGYKITPVEELGRPRVDVVVAASSLFRDTFSNVMTLLDGAIRELSTYTGDEKGSNYISKHYEAIKENYIKQGKSADEAEFLAASRVFSAMPGTQGNGVAEKLGATESWNNSEDVVETYLNRASYIYGTDKKGNAVYGQEGKDAFVEALKNVQATVHIIDSTYGTLDNDDVAGDLGGLTMAAKWASKKDVAAYIANTRLGLKGAKVQTIENFVAQELDSRLLNPEYVKAMLAEGYAGASTLAEYFGNTFFMDSTMNAVNNQAWSDLAKTYLFDSAISSKLDPYCYQSMIGWAAEAARKGMWEASSEDLTKLSDAYVQTMVNYGVVCCHHTCKNIKMNEWIAQFSTLDNDTLSQFQSKLAEATEKDVKIIVDSNAPDNSSSNKKSSNQAKAASTSEAASGSVQISSAVQAKGAGSEEPSPQVAAQASGGVTAGDTIVAKSETVNKNVKATEVTRASSAGNVKNQSQSQSQSYKAYEVSESGGQSKPSGVNAWAIGGVLGVMGLLGGGMILRPRKRL